MELTDEEAAVVADARLLLAKTRATVKVRGHLEALKAALAPTVAAGHGAWEAPDGFDPAAAQIARGENLDGTPYQYLDFPKHFRGDVHFTFRTLVWWGRAACFCWILGGPSLPAFRGRVKARAAELAAAGIGVWFGGDAWDWEGHVALGAVPPDALDTLGFLKVGRRVALADDPRVLTRDGLVAAGTGAFAALEPVVRRP
jgi:hypothetical protein